jgi:hypothetical protein
MRLSSKVTNNRSSAGNYHRRDLTESVSVRLALGEAASSFCRGQVTMRRSKSEIHTETGDANAKSA